MAHYQRLRDLREDADKTQQEIADYLGTSAQHYGKYESGKAEIPLERAVLLAKYYNVSLDYIAGISSSRHPLACESVICNEAPDDTATEQCVALGKALAS